MILYCKLLCKRSEDEFNEGIKLIMKKAEDGNEVAKGILKSFFDDDDDDEN